MKIFVEYVDFLPKIFLIIGNLENHKCKYILSQDISSSTRGLDKLVSLPPLPYPTAIVAENATATPQLIELMSIILLAITYENIID